MNTSSSRGSIVVKYFSAEAGSGAVGIQYIEQRIAFITADIPDFCSASTAEVRYIGSNEGDPLFNGLYTNSAGARLSGKVFDHDGAPRRASVHLCAIL